ncbi:hypothetical protein AAFF_G00154440 [Aldrovandia affinis]|uniref:Uncharacterized protein n=1 Tax=Aldrovandia affinis TaxID=143900 RepID=A0AAD7WW61_9TELE|nr:hypothetical protein AAFF_G00154440 [Aldrovandia affinis]
MGRVGDTSTQWLHGSLESSAAHLFSSAREPSLQNNNNSRVARVPRDTGLFGASIYGRKHIETGLGGQHLGDASCSATLQRPSVPPCSRSSSSGGQRTAVARQAERSGGSREPCRSGATLPPPVDAVT